MEVLNREVVIKSLFIRRATYPVGSDMEGAKAQADAYGKEFLKIEEYYFKDLFIWCRGSSGAILASLLYNYLRGCNKYGKIKICHVKKPAEESHSASPYCRRGGVNVVIDDFISSGDTIRAIIKNMRCIDMDSYQDIPCENNVLMACEAKALDSKSRSFFNYIITDES